MLTGGEKEPERIMNIMYYTGVSLFKFFGKYPAEKGKKRRRKSCKKIRVVNTQNYDKFSLHEESYTILYFE
jgi:hypothetical protein